MLFKKGQELSMTYIVIAAIALVVLVVVVLFFTGGLSKMLGTQKDVTTGATDQQKSVWKATCDSYCALRAADSFCNHIFDGPKDSQSGYIVKVYKCSSMGIAAAPSAPKYGGNSLTPEPIGEPCANIDKCPPA